MPSPLALENCCLVYFALLVEPKWVGCRLVNNGDMPYIEFEGKQLNIRGKMGLEVNVSMNDNTCIWLWN